LTSSAQTLAEKTLFFQHLGYQTAVSLEQLHRAADGIPAWPDDSLLVCGACTSDATEGSTPDPSTCPTDVPTQIPSSCPAPVPVPSSTSLRSLVHSKDFARQLFAPDNRSYLFMHQLTRNQQRILWHQRLGHMHSRCVSDLHKYAIGIPQLPLATELDKCPVCLHAKLHHANKSLEESRRALQPNQGISVDYGFLVQKSSNPSRLQCLTGLNGETCYCLIVDHKT
jgi:GAG-pre-integrase domain